MAAMRWLRVSFLAWRGEWMFERAATAHAALRKTAAANVAFRAAAAPRSRWQHRRNGGSGVWLNRSAVK